MIKLKSLLVKETINQTPDGGLEISSPEEITDEQWNKIAKIIYQKGYNIRDGDDAKRAVGEFLKRKNGVLPPTLDFYKDWISAIKIVLGILKKVKTENPNAKKVFALAKRELGVTPNLKLAGYILPDGSLIKLSHEGYTRDLDHREIVGVFQKLGIAPPENNFGSATPYMELFITMGAIRINGEGPQVELGAAPTGAQEKILGRIFAINNGEIDLDLGDKDYGKVGQHYPSGTSPITILHDINIFYRKGTLPKRSEFREISNVNKNGYEFVGFHRQRHQRPSPRDDIFLVSSGNGGNYYGKEYFVHILDSLYHRDRDEAMANGWFDFDWSNEFADGYEKKEQEVANWLNEKGYRWIFVTENRPHDVEGYGEYIYKIYFKKQEILQIFDDPCGANDVAYAYVYHIKNPPIAEPYDQT